MNIQSEVPLAPHTTFRIGGTAAKCFELREDSDLELLRTELTDQFDKIFVLGRGSNVLFPNQTVQRPIVRFDGAYTDISTDGTDLIAGAAVHFPKLAIEAADRGLTGLEWAAGVPGSVGGAVIMNAGAFDSNTSEHLSSVTVYDPENGIRTIDSDTIDFGYRECDLRGDSLVLRATFSLARGNPDDLQNETRRLLQTRRRNQPVGELSAGCVFKNPNGESAGFLIEEAGLKGCSEGDITVSDIHANYFINQGQGTYDDVLRLIDRVRSEVYEQFSYELPLELQIYDE